MTREIKFSLISILRAKVLYQAVIIFVLVAVVIPALTYFCVYDLGDKPGEEFSTCVIQYDYRVPCGFYKGREMGNVTSYTCKSVGCCFDEHTNTCYHYFPAKYGYRSTEDETVFSSKREETMFGTPMHNRLKLTITPTKNYIDAALTKGKDVEVVITPSRKAENELMPGISYNMTLNNLVLDIYRTDAPDDKILQTSRGPLVASDGYWEWTVQLTNANGTLYGLSGLEITGNFTKVLYKNEMDHSNVPFFLARKLVGKHMHYHALLVKHQGLLEIQILASKLMILRALNTTDLSLRFFPGPTLADVQKQMTLSEEQPTIPRWLLGTHICKNSITDFQEMLKEFVQEQRFNTLGAVSDCFNELLMITMIEMYDDPTPERRDSMKHIIQTWLKTKFVLPLTPHIPIGVEKTEDAEARNYTLFNTAVEMDVLLKNESKQIHRGMYKQRAVAFLNPEAPKAVEYLTLLLSKLSETTTMPLEKIAGVFLFDNWPQDESYNFTAVNKPLVYFNEEILTALNKIPGLVLERQETYVQNQIKIIQQALGRDVPILSASYFYQHNNPLLPQHVNKTWTNLKDAISRTLFTNVFTQPLVLNPICGTETTMASNFHENELCSRWFLNQATLPGQRITTNWFTNENFTETSRAAVNKALRVKKMLSYYQYTLLQEKHQVVAPMFMDYQEDNVTWSLHEQYLMGDLLVVPILLPQVTMRRLYLPVEHTWFEFWGGKNFNSGWLNTSVARNEQLMFIKESSLIPLLKEEKQADDYFELMVVKSCKYGRQVITGSIFFDNVALKLEFLDRFLVVSNILKVQEDIKCGETQRAHPHVIKIHKIIHCLRSELIVNVIFDICAETNKDKESVLIQG